MINIKKIAAKLNGIIDGNSNLSIKGVSDLRTASKNDISFLSDSRYYKYFEKSLTDAVIVHNDFSLNSKNKTLIRVDNPVYAYIQTLEIFGPTEIQLTGTHHSAIISKNAVIGSNVYIGPNVVIEDGVKIGNNTKINTSCFIGKNTKVGSNCILNVNSTIHHDCIIGNKVIIESGAVIGTSGFGLTFHKNEHHIIPHNGKVILMDNVWVGANCAIDRGTINDTVIGKGTKMDNLIQIAHNVQIGKHCIIAGQSAIAGSTVIGDYVTIAGQVGIIGHLKIGDKTTIASCSQVTKSLSSNSYVSGIPARDHKKNLKLNALFNTLDKILKKNK